MVPSFRALSGRFRFTVQRHESNNDSLLQWSVEQSTGKGNATPHQNRSNRFRRHVSPLIPLISKGTNKKKFLRSQRVVKSRNLSNGSEKKETGREAPREKSRRSSTLVYPMCTCAGPYTNVHRSVTSHQKYCRQGYLAHKKLPPPRTLQ